MSRLRLTEVADTTRSSKEYWDDRNDKLWGRQFHGHFLDANEVVVEMDRVNISQLKYIIKKWVIKRSNAGLDRKLPSVLECACGIGRYIEHLYPSIDQYTGIDFATKNIEQAIEQYGHLERVQFIESDMLNYSSTEKYDLIFMVAAMSSIEEQSAEIVDHLFSLLNPGGSLAIFEQNLYMVKWR